METLRLDSELQNQFFDLKREGSVCWRNRQWADLKDKMLEAWAIIPEPKLEYDVSYLASWMICEALLQLREFETAKDWIVNHNKADKNRVDSGEREFMEGRFLFAQGSKEEAKSKFQIAFQKSDGRLFKSSTNIEHESFFEDYKNLLDNEIIRPSDFKGMLSEAQNEMKNGNYPNALSMLYDCLNIKLEDPFIHLNKGICHYELNELDYAADSFTIAFMREGEDLFKNQDAKYFNFLKTRIEIK